MSDWSWKQALAGRIIQIVNDRSSINFSIDELYEAADYFSVLFPRNRHVKEKIRQTLQQLRDDGFLSFQGEGHYQLNLTYQELEGDPAPLGVKGVESPTTKQVLRNVRLRCSFLASEVKRRYKNICQVCRTPVVIAAQKYFANAHHLWPLGSPHFGPDLIGNIIVLCPNHHAMFDRGAVSIVPDSLVVLHKIEGVFSPRTRIYLESWHSLGQKYLKYHHGEIFRAG